MALLFVYAESAGKARFTVERPANNWGMPNGIETHRGSIEKQRMEKRTIEKQKSDLLWDYSHPIKKRKRRKEKK